MTLVVDYLKKYTTTNIYVVGHTDDTGSLSLNLDLSKQRADAVINYLNAQGIPKSRMIADGVGPFAPVSNNETEKGKKLNRRVEIVKQLK